MNDEEKRLVRKASRGLLPVCAVSLYLAYSLIISDSTVDVYGISFLIIGVSSGYLSIGGLLRPDSIGRYMLDVAEFIGGYEEEEETHTNAQSMEGSHGSGQAIAKDGAKINQTIYNVPPPAETSNRGKVCPECLGDGKMSCFMTYCHEGYVTPPGLEPGESDKKCGICKGKGVVLCDKCEGEGRIDT